MKLQYRYTNTATIKEKVSAWIELFGVENTPSVRLSGTWKDKRGDAVFFDITDSDPVISIGRKSIVVNVDGKKDELIGTADSYYTLS